MQSLLSLLVIIGTLFFMAASGADGTARKAYYAIAAVLWILTAFLAYQFYFKPTLPIPDGTV